MKTIDPYGFVIMVVVGLTVATANADILVTRTQTGPVINSGPVSFGLSELPVELDVTILLGPGFPTGGGATGYGLDEVISANAIFGDGVFTELIAFDFEVEANGAIEALSATFAPIITPSVSGGGIIMNSPAHISGTDIASGLPFSYTYAESTDTTTTMTLLGDVNLDCVINLLDVAPFVDRLATGTFQIEADINLDGVVNLLDVDPFIQLLSGG